MLNPADRNRCPLLQWNGSVWRPAPGIGVVAKRRNRTVGSDRESCRVREEGDARHPDRRARRSSARLNAGAIVGRRRIRDAQRHGRQVADRNETSLRVSGGVAVPHFRLAIVAGIDPVLIV